MNNYDWKQMYRRLGGAERFRVFASALAREDIQEARRLVRTLPRESGHAVREFLAAKDEAFALMEMAARQLTYYCGWLGALELMDRYLHTGMAEMAMGSGDGPRAVGHLVSKARTEGIAKIRAVLDAYADVARDRGLDPRFMLSILPANLLLILAPHDNDISAEASVPGRTDGWREFLSRDREGPPEEYPQ